MEGNILYRKLALRSRLGFGRYCDCTVQDLLNAGQQEYLIWVYYNCSRIDFLPDVREAIGISEVIDKPGVAPQYFEAYKATKFKKFDEMTEDEKKRFFGSLSRYKAILRARARRAERWDEAATRPGVLQAINHGHKKSRF